MSRLAGGETKEVASALVIFFSFTSNVRTLAASIESHLSQNLQVTKEEIRPKTSRNYWGWLWRSFLPDSTVPINRTTVDLRPYDLVCLGFPKWTVSCPPLNQYLKAIKGVQGKKFAVFMSYGGFDQERYLRDVIGKLQRRKARVVAKLCVQKCLIAQGSHLERIEDFSEQIIQALPMGGPGLLGPG